jgi:hypothetical protein
LDDGNVGEACNSGLQTQTCKQHVLDGAFHLMILSSPEKVRAFEEIFSGRSWQIGKYHIFELGVAAKDSGSIESHGSRIEARK